MKMKERKPREDLLKTADSDFSERHREVEELEKQLAKERGKKHVIEDKLEIEYERMVRYARIVGTLEDAEAFAERLLQLRKEKVERLEMKHHNNLKRGSKYRGALLKLAETCHAIGNIVRIQIPQAKNGSMVVFDRKLDQQRLKRDTFVSEKMVFFNDRGVQERVHQVLQSRVAKAEEFLYRALEIRRDVLGHDLTFLGLESETTVSKDKELSTLRKLVAESLSSLSIVQTEYGLESAEQAHEEALSLFACEPIESDSYSWSFDAVQEKWERIEKWRGSKRGSTQGLVHMNPQKDASQLPSQSGIIRLFQCTFGNFRTRKLERVDVGSVLEKDFSKAELEDGSVGRVLGKQVPMEARAFDWRLVADHGLSMACKPPRNLLPPIIELSPDHFRGVQIGCVPKSDVQSHRVVKKEKNLSVQLYGFSLGKNHAKLEFRSDLNLWEITELDNGRYGGVVVNRVRVHKAFLSDGDEIVLGGAFGVGRGESHPDWLDGIFNEGKSQRIAVKYRVERLWHYSPLSVFPSDTFVSPEDLPYSHFHALVVTEYVRHRSHFPNAIPDLMALGISRFETRRLYKTLCEQGVPLHYWSTWIAARFRKEITDQFIQYYHRRELNYFGL